LQGHKNKALTRAVDAWDTYAGVHCKKYKTSREALLAWRCARSPMPVSATQRGKDYNGEVYCVTLALWHMLLPHAAFFK